MKQVKNQCGDWLALVSGTLLALAFSPFELSYIGIFSLVLLFLSWQKISPKRAAIRGYLFGLGLFGLGVSWVFISVYEFGGAGLILSVLLTVLFVGFWAIFPALSGYIAVKFFFAKSRVKTIIIFPTVWLLIEYLRGQWVFNGFPWLQIAYSQLDTPLAGYIPIFGVYGVGWIFALTASSLTLLIIYKDKLALFSLVLVCCFWVTGWLLKDISWTHTMGSPIKVTMVQGNIAQDKKWNSEYRNKIMQTYKEQTYQHWDSQIIIWPESAVPAFLHQVNEEFLIPLDQEAKRENTDLIISLPIKTVDFKKYNAVITRGNNNAEYHKIHLLPFGEYLPLQPFSNYLLNSLKTLPVGSFTAGSRDQPLLEAGGYAFITTICYEDAFGEEGIRNLSKAAFLVNVTNDGWFGDTIEPYQHMQIARMRALEAGRYLLRATNNGVTAFVSPKGKVIKQAPLFTETTLTEEIFPMSGLTPYSVYGDKPVIYTLFFILINAFIVTRYFYQQEKMFLSRIFYTKDSSK